MTISAVPERIIQHVLVSGLRQIRNNYKILAALFQDLTDTEFHRIVDFIAKTPINFSINYPRKELTPPSFVLLMKSEGEADTFLGDHMGYGAPPEEHTAYHSSNVSGLQGLPEKIIGPISVSVATPSTIGVDSAAFAEWASTRTERLEDIQLYIRTGTGSGHVYNINKITSTSVDIEGTFVVDLDSTTEFDIRFNVNPDSIGEPVRVYDPDALLYRKGANYAASYQLDIISGNPEEVIYLYMIAKAILFANKGLLEDQGIQGLEISGSDLAPRSEYVPDEVFTRSMTLKFHYPFSILHEEQVFSELRIVSCDGMSLGNITLN